jgi:hypothetical protein
MDVLTCWGAMGQVRRNCRAIMLMSGESSLTMAVLGDTVFVPSPMYPDFRPQMVQVGSYLKGVAASISLSAAVSSRGP